jgi:hypothetical protein
MQPVTPLGFSTAFIATFTMCSDKAMNTRGVEDGRRKIDRKWDG